jgi:hypothetical protein
MQKAIGVVLAVFGVAFGAIYFAAHRGEDAHASSLPRTSAPVAALKVTAAEYVAAYSENEVGAEARYLGKPLEISGAVGSVTRTLGDVSVILQGPFLGNASCGIDAANVASVATLKRGDAVTLRCVGAGTSLGAPILRSCTLVR